MSDTPKQYNKRSCPNNPTHSYIYSYKHSIPIIILFVSTSNNLV